MPNKPRPATKASNPVGRPPKYEPGLADEICRRLISGESLLQICRDEKMPHRDTVYAWLAADVGGFSDKYARAKQRQADHFAEEILEIADDGTNDWMQREQGGDTVTVADHEHIQRSRLRVDARKWLMAKMAPKRYGERVELEHVGKDRGPIEYADRTAALALIDEALREPEAQS